MNLVYCALLQSDIRYFGYKQFQFIFYPVFLIMEYFFPYYNNNFIFYKYTITCLSIWLIFSTLEMVLKHY